MQTDAQTGSESARMAIFAALVALQDRRVPVAASRLRAAELFVVPLELVQSIEAEGLEKEWPLL